jgi:hypothetical protein
VERRRIKVRASRPKVKRPELAAKPPLKAEARPPKVAQLALATKPLKVAAKRLEVNPPGLATKSR